MVRPALFVTLLAPCALAAPGSPGLSAQGKPPRAAPAAPAPSPGARWAPRGTLALADTVRDSLVRRDPLLPADRTYAQQWRLPGTAGELVTIDLSSAAFDAYLFLLGPGLERDQPQDDDSGGSCNARLVVRLPETADYDVVVTTSEPLATGPFTLVVTAGAKPASLVPCTR